MTTMTIDERIARAAKEYIQKWTDFACQCAAHDAFLAGAAFGREEQRERDAKICDAAVERNLHGNGEDTAPEHLAAAIRADGEGKMRFDIELSAEEAENLFRLQRLCGHKTLDETLGKALAVFLPEATVREVVDPATGEKWQEITWRE